MNQEDIARINELAAIHKTRALTDEETQERARLREMYLADFRRNMKAQLDQTYVEKPDGTRVPVRAYNASVEDKPV